MNAYSDLQYLACLDYKQARELGLKIPADKLNFFKVVEFQNNFNANVRSLGKELLSKISTNEIGLEKLLELYGNESGKKAEHYYNLLDVLVLKIPADELEYDVLIKYYQLRITEKLLLKIPANKLKEYDVLVQDDSFLWLPDKFLLKRFGHKLELKKLIELQKSNDHEVRESAKTFAQQIPTKELDQWTLLGSYTEACVYLEDCEECNIKKFTKDLLHSIPTNELEFSTLAEYIDEAYFEDAHNAVDLASELSYKIPAHELKYNELIELRQSSEENARFVIREILLKHFPDKYTEDTETQTTIDDLIKDVKEGFGI